MGDMTEDDIVKAQRELKAAGDILKRLSGKPCDSSPPVEGPYCSFCGKGKTEYRQIISGPCVYICDKCVAQCQRILRQDGATE